MIIHHSARTFVSRPNPMTGVYDIHSPRLPDVAEMETLLDKPS
ncbi:hypothetical protein AB395_00006431 (plasmid) [Sinorhizobium fredii CCBAU 45436]|nr:hypothetical protein AB395_00006431 [Sinorhizobium fredii CCBAU 45436]